MTVSSVTHAVLPQNTWKEAQQDVYCHPAASKVDEKTQLKVLETLKKEAGSFLN